MRAGVLMTVGAALALAGCGGAEEGEARAAAAEESATPAATTAAAAAPSVGAAGSFPRVRPGLWRIVQRDADGPGDPDEKCITAEEADRTASDPLAALEMGPSCSSRITQEGSGVVIRSTCPQGTTAEVRTRGDFQNSYAMDVVVRMSTPQRTEIRSTIEGTRIGDC